MHCRKAPAKPQRACGNPPSKIANRQETGPKGRRSTGIGHQSLSRGASTALGPTDRPATPNSQRNGTTGEGERQQNPSRSRGGTATMEWNGTRAILGRVHPGASARDTSASRPAIASESSERRNPKTHPERSGFAERARARTSAAPRDSSTTMHAEVSPRGGRRWWALSGWFLVGLGASKTPTKTPVRWSGGGSEEGERTQQQHTHTHTDAVSSVCGGGTWEWGRRITGAKPSSGVTSDLCSRLAGPTTSA
jgi:hypothetical protein